MVPPLPVREWRLLLPTPSLIRWTPRRGNERERKSRLGAELLCQCVQSRMLQPRRLRPEEDQWCRLGGLTRPGGDRLSLRERMLLRGLSSDL